MRATTATAIRTPMSTRAGASAPDAGSTGPRSDCSSTSRATCAPEAGTRTSRGPAARKSGTSKPAERRSVEGTPSSSSRPCRNSASVWLRAPAAFTSWPSESCGLILRARSWRGVSSASPASRVSGIPQSGQKRSAAGCSAPHDGQYAGSELGDVWSLDPEGPHHRLVPRQPDDDPGRPRPRLGEGDVGLRGVGLRPRVRVVEAGDLEPLLVDLLERAHDLERVDLEAQRAVRLVDHPEDALR